MKPCELTPDFSATRAQTSAQRNSYHGGSSLDHIFSSTCWCAERTGSHCNPTLLLLLALLKRFNSFRSIFLTRLRVFCVGVMVEIFWNRRSNIVNINRKKPHIFLRFFSIQTEFIRLLSLPAMLSAGRSLVKGSGVRWKMDTFGNKEVLGEGLKVLISFVLIAHVKPWLQMSWWWGEGGLFDEGELTREKWHSSLPQPPTLLDTPQITWNRPLFYPWLFILLWLASRQILPVRSNRPTLFLTLLSNSLLFS